MHHELKAHPDSFELLALRQSAVQLRKNDRAYKAGDTCTFFEWIPEWKRWTGRTIPDLSIATVLENHEGLSAGWCLLVLTLPTSNITRFSSRLARCQELPVDSKGPQ